ncbi:DMT family transporter [Sphingomonas sp.]|uniref:DMT family transporter n=1 Tax=Sphingomonas sp. TaxID=28214 RepID=UPI0025ED8E08|nr:DMT family transporter [Sphingomonas sp.]
MGTNLMVNQPESIRPGKADFAALLVANVLLALGPLFVRIADVGPVATGFWRMTLAFPVLALLAARGGPVRLSRGLVVALILSGLLFAADLASWHLGIVRTKLANATLFGNSASLMFPIYGFLAARAWPTRRQGGALGLAAIGGVMLMGRSYELSPEHLVGDLLCLLAGLFYTFYFVMIARARTALAPLPLLAISTLASTVPLLLLAVSLGERILPSDWTPLLLLALCSQLIGQGLLTYVLGRLSPLVIGLGLLAQPVAAAVIGLVIFGERLGAPDLAGAVLVGLALILVRQPDPKAA